MVTKIWPRFRDLILNDNVVYTGAPPRNISDPNDTLARKYCRDVRALRWRTRQVDVMCARPAKFQHDIFLAHLIGVRNGLNLQTLLNRNSVTRLTPEERRNLSTLPVFATKPGVSTRAIRILLRFLAGKEDFARRNGHFKRRRSHSQQLQTDEVKRYCFIFLCPASDRGRRL